MLHPAEEKVFPSHVKLLLLSQSDFALPGPEKAAAHPGTSLFTKGPAF